MTKRQSELLAKFNRAAKDPSQLQEFVKMAILGEFETATTVTNMTQLTQDDCNSLKCGDRVTKVDSTGEHSYVVSYKKENKGMCITYVDATSSETVVYDCTEGVWSYTETIITPLKAPYISTVTPLATSQLVATSADTHHIAYVYFELSAADKERLLASKFIIFTMNNSFVITPLTQSGTVIAAQSFICKDDGSTLVTKVRMTMDETGLNVQFDETFAMNAAEGFTTKPTAILLVAE